MPQSLKIILTTTFCLFIFLCLPDTAAAKTDPKTGLTQPNLQIDIPTVNFGSDAELWIGQYIQGVYKYAVGVVGIMAAIVLMWAGVVWLTAGGSADKVKQAKEWIAAALTGLVLTLGSYTFLYTINPNLVIFKGLKIAKIKPPKTEDALNAEDYLRTGYGRGGIGSGLEDYEGGGCGLSEEDLNILRSLEITTAGPAMPPFLSDIEDVEKKVQEKIEKKITEMRLEREKRRSIKISGTSEIIDPSPENIAQNMNSVFIPLDKNKINALNYSGEALPALGPPPQTDWENYWIPALEAMQKADLNALLPEGGSGEEPSNLWNVGASVFDKNAATEERNINVKGVDIEEMAANMDKKIYNIIGIPRDIDADAVEDLRGMSSERPRQEEWENLYSFLEPLQEINTGVILTESDITQELKRINMEINEPYPGGEREQAEFAGLEEMVEELQKRDSIIIKMPEFKGRPIPDLENIPAKPPENIDQYLPLLAPLQEVDLSKLTEEYAEIWGGKIEFETSNKESKKAEINFGGIPDTTEDTLDNMRQRINTIIPAPEIDFEPDWDKISAGEPPSESEWEQITEILKSYQPITNILTAPEPKITQADTEISREPIKKRVKIDFQWTPEMLTDGQPYTVVPAPNVKIDWSKIYPAQPPDESEWPEIQNILQQSWGEINIDELLSEKKDSAVLQVPLRTNVESRDIKFTWMPENPGDYLLVPAYKFGAEIPDLTEIPVEPPENWEKYRMVLEKLREYEAELPEPKSMSGEIKIKKSNQPAPQSKSQIHNLMPSETTVTGIINIDDFQEVNIGRLEVEGLINEVYINEMKDEIYEIVDGQYVLVFKLTEGGFDKGEGAEKEQNDIYLEVTKPTPAP